MPAVRTAVAVSGGVVTASLRKVRYASAGRQYVEAALVTVGAALFMMIGVCDERQAR